VPGLSCPPRKRNDCSRAYTLPGSLDCATRIVPAQPGIATGRIVVGTVEKSGIDRIVYFEDQILPEQVFRPVTDSSSPSRRGSRRSSRDLRDP